MVDAKSITRFEGKDIFSATPSNIWNFRQNHPELIIKDCEDCGFTDEQIRIIRQSMLVRGINKWLKVRRDLIAYKKQIKHGIKALNVLIPILKAEMNDLYCTNNQLAEGSKSINDLRRYYRKRIEYQSAKEKLKLLAEIRGTLKGLCMTNRWQIWQGKRLGEMNTIRASD